MQDYIGTYKGNRFYYDVERYDENTFDIEEIAHSLSMLCRFNGHTKKFYSVAEHCYHTSLIIPIEYRLHALLHDAQEAYITDIPTPLKNKLKGPLIAMEDEFQRRIFLKFECKQDARLHIELNLADKKMLRAEAMQLMVLNDWSKDLPKHNKKIEINCWNPVKAKKMFLFRYFNLMSNKEALDFLND